MQTFYAFFQKSLSDHISGQHKRNNHNKLKRPYSGKTQAKESASKKKKKRKNSTLIQRLFFK